MIERIPITGTKMIELNYDLSKRTRLAVPAHVENAIVKINFVIYKDELASGKIDKILEAVLKKKPMKCFIGNVKTHLRDKARKEKEIPLNLSDEELIKAYVQKFANPKIAGFITDEALEIHAEVRDTNADKVD